MDRTRDELNTGWSERYLGGSQETEAELLRVYAEQIQQVQERNRRGKDEPIRRAFHAKLLAGVTDARFAVAEDIRAELRVGLFVPGATYPAMVRLSNASGIVGSDSARDLRGIAIRVELVGGQVQDFLMTNLPASHARDARQFMAAAVAMAGGRRLGAAPGLVRELGLREAFRLTRALRQASGDVKSLATETFWSRAPFALGPYAVKFKLHPLAAAGETGAAFGGPNYLRDEFVDRLRRDDVRYALRVLHYVDERITPIEDATVEWTERAAPLDTVAELVIPRQDLTVEGSEGERMVDRLEFNPWNSTDGIRPIGGLNRARKPVYEASARLRSQGS